MAKLSYSGSENESRCLSKINGMVPRAGFEHATTRSSAERSPRLSYLGTQFWEYHIQR
jgi:hypothetical protein